MALGIRELYNFYNYIECLLELFFDSKIDILSNVFYPIVHFYINNGGHYRLGRNEMHFVFLV